MAWYVDALALELAFGNETLPMKTEYSRFSAPHCAVMHDLGGCVFTFVIFFPIAAVEKLSLLDIMHKASEDTQLYQKSEQAAG